MTRLACDRAGLVKAEPSRPGNAGGGILNFLKTELDSFVKGLSGRANEEDIVHPPKKRTKRSHRRNAANDTRSDAWGLEADLQRIRQHTSARLQQQDYTPLTEANLRASTQYGRLDLPSQPNALRPPECDHITAVDGASTYHDAVEALPMTATLTSSVPQNTAYDAFDAVQRRKRHRAVTIVHDDDGQWMVHNDPHGLDATTQLTSARSQDEISCEAANAKNDRDRKDREVRRKRQREAAVNRQSDNPTDADHKFTEVRSKSSHSAKHSGHGTIEKIGVTSANVDQYIINERQRISHLEREVERLKRELALSQQSSSRSTEFQSGDRNPVLTKTSATPVPIAPPPPPMASQRLPTGAQPSPIALLVAKKASLNRTHSEKKPPKAGLALAADMSKFLAEMKTTKLRKVGLPIEGVSNKRASIGCEDEGLKSILETVLRKRFTGQSTAKNKQGAEAITRRSTQSDLSTSTTTSSLTSFSSYRPPDWNAILDTAPMPPMRASTVEAGVGHGAMLAADTAGYALETSNDSPYRPWSRIARFQTESALMSTGTARCFQAERPTQVFGHSLISDEPPQPKSYKLTFDPLSTHQTGQHSSLRHSTSRFPELIYRNQELSRQSSLGNVSMRTKGSSFDVEIYAHMPLRGVTDELEDETRRSYERPPSTGGNMDLPTHPCDPIRKQDSVRSSMHVDSGYASTVFPSSRSVSFTKISGEATGGASPTVASNRSPRPKPLPPLGASYIRQRRSAANLTEVCKANSIDKLGRPISPAKSRLRASRAFVKDADIQISDSGDEMQGLELSDAQADALIAEVENECFTGLGQR